MPGTKFQTIDQYIATFPKDVQDSLQKIREVIKKAVPEAEEIISYNIPAFKFHGFLLYFSAYKSHYSLSFIPSSAIYQVFEKELASYKKSVSTIQFPFDKPLPLKLIRDIAKLRAKENIKGKRK